jgi:hypothetical protein
MAESTEHDFSETIAELKQLRPEPTARFYDRMAQAPWSPASLPRPVPGALLKRLGLGVGLAGLMVIVLLATPLRTAADQLFSYFQRAAADQVIFEVNPSASTPAFGFSRAEVETMAGFQVSVASIVAADYSLSSMAYDAARKAVIQDFTSPLPGRFLRLTQMIGPDAGLSYGQIGLSAEVRQIQLVLANGSTTLAEYVIGAWRSPPMQPALETAHPNITVTMQASWNPQANVHMLRWISDGYVYELIHADSEMDQPEPELLIKMAEGIK